MTKLSEWCAKKCACICFQVNLSDIGEIYKIRIGHGDSDRESGWYLEKVCEIDAHASNNTRQERYLRTCNLEIVLPVSSLNVF